MFRADFAAMSFPGIPKSLVSRHILITATKVLIIYLLLCGSSYASVIANRIAEHTIISKYSALDITLEEAVKELNRIFKKESF